MTQITNGRWKVEVDVAKGLDKIDRKILNLLQENARMPVKDIAEHVFLSSPAVTVRIQHLEEDGYIEGYHAKLNLERVGMGIKAFIKVALNTRKRAEFLQYLENFSNVMASYTITGDYSILLETVFESTRDLDSFLQGLQNYGNTHTDIVFLTSTEQRRIILPVDEDDIDD